jgi:hypothetical protein
LVIPIHCHVCALTEYGNGGIPHRVDNATQRGGFTLIEAPEHMVHGINVGCGTPDAHTDPAKPVITAGIDQRSYSSVSAIPPFRFNFYSSKCQVHIIVNDNHFPASNTPLRQKQTGGCPAPVHVRHGLDQRNAAAADGTDAECRSVSKRVHHDATVHTQRIDGHKTDTVARERIRCPWVPKTDDQPIRE